MNPFGEWLWEWEASNGIDPDQGQPLRYDWTSVGAPSHTLFPSYLEIAAGLTEEHYFSKVYGGTDWSLYTLYTEIRLRIMSYLFTNGVDSGVRLVVDNGEKRAIIGFIKGAPEDSDFGQFAEEIVREQYLIGVLTSGSGSLESHWGFKSSFPWPANLMRLHIELNPNDGLKVYANEFGDIVDGDLLLDVPYNSLPNSVARGIRFGKFTNGAANIRFLYLKWHTVALSRVQPAWTLFDGSNREYEIEVAQSNIHRKPFVAPLNLTQIITYLDSYLVAAGWTQLPMPPGTSPDGTDGILYRLGTLQNFWLYFWYSGGLLKFLFYDYNYGLWNTLNVQPPPYGTHPVVSMSLTVYQQSFLLVDQGSLFWFTYGENAVTELAGYILVDVMHSIYESPPPTSPGFIACDDNQNPIAYQRGVLANWIDLEPNREEDPGNIGNNDVVYDILRVRHTQPSLITYVSWRSFFREVSQNNTLIPDDVVVVDNNQLVVLRNRFQTYQFHWGSRAALYPAEQEVRFFPVNILITSEGLMGSILVDEDQRLWIRCAMGPSGPSYTPLSHWVGGPFGTELEVDG